jgi:hypothetical protein
MYTLHKVGDRMEPCGTPICTFPAVVISPLTEIHSRSFDSKKTGVDNKKKIVK